MKKGKEFFKELTTSQKIKFRENLRQQSLPEFRENKMKKLYPSLVAFVAGAFIWDDTKQGNNYWFDVATEKK